jgi:hypothetical protein
MLRSHLRNHALAGPESLQDTLYKNCRETDAVAAGLKAEK